MVTLHEKIITKRKVSTVTWFDPFSWQCCSSYHRACVFYTINFREKHLINLGLLYRHSTCTTLILSCLQRVAIHPWIITSFEFDLTLLSLSSLEELSKMFLVRVPKKNDQAPCVLLLPLSPYQEIKKVWMPVVRVCDVQSFSSLFSCVVCPQCNSKRHVADSQWFAGSLVCGR